MKKYPKKIEQIYQDIVELKVQGATNVAIATFEGIKIALQNNYLDEENIIQEVIEIGKYLAYARPNEPLAQNGILYLRHFFVQNGGNNLDYNRKKELILQLCSEFLKKVSSAKHKIDVNNSEKLSYIDHILTHCHSSTAVRLIQGISKGDENFTAVCTETRPRLQGRKTAKELLEAGIDTTFIADSAAELFVIGRGSKPVSAVFVGCDAITMKGHFINKIGTWGIAMAAHQSNKPVFVVTPLLKMDHDTAYSDIKIEVREDKELWKDGPKDLEMYNPAFEVVDANLLTGYITEYGIIEPNQIGEFAIREYPWLFEE